MNDLLDQFLIEGRELVHIAADDLLALERDPDDTARIGSAFRAVHSLKGAAGLFDFAAMGAALHAAEDVLGAIRERQLAASHATITVLLDCVAAVERWFEAIGSTGGLPASADTDSQRLRAALGALLTLPGAPAPAPAAADDRSWVPGLLARAEAAEPAAATRAVTALRYTPLSESFFLGDDPLALVGAVPELLFLHVDSRLAVADDSFDPFACRLTLTALSAASVEDVRPVFRLVADQVVVTPAAASAVVAKGLLQASTRSLRVDAGRIDTLADLVSELIVAKNALAHLAGRAAQFDAGLARALAANQAEFDRLAGALHRGVMGVRMLPLSRLFQRLTLLVRETAAKLSREVVFTMSGAEVEADKTVVDGLFEPLLHVLRNAIDHGIEPQALRRSAGKPEAGRVTLTAARAGEQIVLTVTDDGAGIDPRKVRDRAKARGLLDEATIDALDDAAALALVFTPGFSTADTVSEISGRGVGLDAVRAAVEAMGGRVDIGSRAGEGSVITLSLPQAAMVTTVMTVQAGGELVGVPLEVVVETARITAGQILPLRGGEAFVLRDRTLPVLNLAALLGRRKPPRARECRLLVVAAGEHRVAVEVDGFVARTDVQVRPMTGLLAGMRGMLGYAVLGDGQVLMVLDIAELIG